ncbi:MAG: phosphopantetheine-binding protein [Nitrospirota bacterium]
MEKTEVVRELKELIITRLKLEDISADEIDENSPLFGEGLGLDSIDALELVVALEKNYGIRVPDEDVGKEAFRSVAALADYVIKNKTL